MSELKDEWGRRLEEAEKRARQSGRTDVIDYLNLRAANDEARLSGVEWLLASFVDVAGEANRRATTASINIARQENHRFESGNSSMVGTLLTLRSGVRSLSIEAGWPRAPQDGIVPGGGLAFARVRHFGNSQANEELLLVRESGATPVWISVEFLQRICHRLGPLREDQIRQHVSRVIS